MPTCAWPTLYKSAINLITINYNMKSIIYKPITPTPSTRLSPDLCKKLKPLGLSIDSSVTIGRNLMFERAVRLNPGCSAVRLRIGSYSYSSPGTSLITTTIGRYCTIGHQVEFGLGYHQIHGVTASPSIIHNRQFMDYSGFIPLSRDHKRPDGEETSVITLGHDVWVGCHCLFPKDVTIGHGFHH